MIEQGADVVQSGVQIMNYKSRWFSALNILEYFFWFKSVLHFFAQQGLVPLGGNTVFMKRPWVEKVGGWDESILTEDADMGIRLSIAGASMKVLYDERTVTKEEAPITIYEFIKQRTRWNQGFLQIAMKLQSYGFVNNKQKLICLYILGWHIIQSFFILYAFFSLFLAFFISLPPVVVLLSIVPLFLLFMQQIFSMVALFEFEQKYGFKPSVKTVAALVITTYPYYLLLGISSLRALIRILSHDSSWEKTTHINEHRMYSKNYLPL